jgi:hypothetical protein
MVRHVFVIFRQWLCSATLMNCVAVYIRVCVSLHILGLQGMRMAAQAVMFLISAREVHASNLS